ncbi:hypothetical protein CEUSTIGMA_g7677.t1 [Chlamydomonas eustigma]|uniref:Uncharacterized protein n=1 Tax=Chlamydomonas eustigma TaxID=1157962 RepID=A0A250XBG8_9CHLO|nr:hypothetical protein CEUSTIGMA_g7677.t1 [Chlamydomonas eustigma]|eukprot:GAX80239.1 hypothetical protein CEUSTIGMA_g7677.t1 [Chlamydomonas eustigma]
MQAVLENDDLLAMVLALAGAWKPESSAEMQQCITSWSVCRAWRACLLRRHDTVAHILLSVHQPEEALLRAASCPISHIVDSHALVRYLLCCHPGHDHGGIFNSQVLVRAISAGNEDIARTLLEHASSEPAPDSLDDSAFFAAAQFGRPSTLQLLLKQDLGKAPQRNHQRGSALVMAAGAGHASVVRLLLEWPYNAPRADCQGGWALVAAARGDCLEGEALIAAAGAGHLEVVRMLLEWPIRAPPPDCQGRRALLAASNQGHAHTLRLLEACLNNSSWGGGQGKALSRTENSVGSAGTKTEKKTGFFKPIMFDALACFGFSLAT